MRLPDTHNNRCRQRSHRNIRRRRRKPHTDNQTSQSRNNKHQPDITHRRHLDQLRDNTTQSHRHHTDNHSRPGAGQRDRNHILPARRKRLPQIPKAMPQFRLPTPVLRRQRHHRTLQNRNQAHHHTTRKRRRLGLETHNNQKVQQKTNRQKIMQPTGKHFKKHRRLITRHTPQPQLTSLKMRNINQRRIRSKSRNSSRFDNIHIIRPDHILGNNKRRRPHDRRRQLPVRTGRYLNSRSLTSRIPHFLHQRNRERPRRDNIRNTRARNHPRQTTAQHSRLRRTTPKSPHHAQRKIRKIPPSTTTLKHRAEKYKKIHLRRRHIKRQLEIEREAIKREGDKEKVKSLQEVIANLQDDLNTQKAKWQAEKDLIDKVQKLKEQIEQFKFEAEQAEREGNYGKVAEIRYGRIKEAQATIDKLNEELEEKQAESKLIKEEVDAEDIAEIVARWTGIPVSRMLQSEREKLLHLEDELHKRVIGQDEAITAVSDAVRRSRAGLQDEKKPVGSFIFLGSTGVGKTELAKALAEYLFDDENLMTRIDMSEYQERHSVSRLVGAPPGYVGYDEGGQLTEAVRRKPYSVVLLDEIEKAHHDVFNILLQVLDDGLLTDNKGRHVNFKNTIVIMTSNIGSHLIQSKFEKADNKNDNEILAQTKNEVFELLRQNIRPEFLNRVDEIIMFTPLNFNDIKQIVRLQFGFLKKKLEKSNIHVILTDSAVEWIAKAGYEPQYGARPVKRIIQRTLMNELSKQILSQKITKDDMIKIDCDNDQLIFRTA